MEILSDYHRGTDLILKRSRYERAGVSSYWIVDPDSRKIKVLELGPDGAFREAFHADLGAAPLAVESPFP